jgi:hypothetical protein
MHGGTGGKVAAPVWTRFMESAAPLQRAINIKKGKRWEINVPDYSIEPIEDERPQERDSEENAIIAEHEAPIANEQANQLQYAYAGQSMNTGVVVFRPDSALSSRSQDQVNAGQRAMETSVCADSGLPASEYCQVTVARRVDDSIASRICGRHRAPAGEPLTEAQWSYQISSASGTP